MANKLQEMGLRMRARRKELGITQEQVAEGCNITKSTVCRYEKGQITEPHRPTVDAIARQLLVHPEWLLLQRDDPEPAALQSEGPADVRAIMNAARAQLMRQEGLMFDGEPVSPEAIQSILSAMEIGLEMARKMKK